MVGITGWPPVRRDSPVPWAREVRGRSSNPANRRPRKNAIPTRPPNFNQFRERTDMSVSPRVKQVSYRKQYSDAFRVVMVANWGLGIGVSGPGNHPQPPNPPTPNPHPATSSPHPQSRNPPRRRL